MYNKQSAPVAITRPVSNTISECELTHLARSPIDINQAQKQHKIYEQTLEKLGYSILQLPAAHDLPDAVFIEDIAIFLPEIAIITRPGAVSRRPELKTVKPALSKFREFAEIKAPATLDGGDVLVPQETIFTGLSNRTNSIGLAQLAAITRLFGYSVTGIPLKKCGSTGIFVGNNLKHIDIVNLTIHFALMPRRDHFVAKRTMPKASRWGKIKAVKYLTAVAESLLPLINGPPRS